MVSFIRYTRVAIPLLRTGEPTPNLFGSSNTNGSSSSRSCAQSQILQTQHEYTTSQTPKNATYLLDQLPSDRMEQPPSTLIRSDRFLMIDLVRSPEQRPAELHPSLDDPTLFADHPVKHGLYEELSCRRRRVFENDEVEWRADLRVGRLRKLVKRIQLQEVARGEGWVRLEAFQEHGCMAKSSSLPEGSNQKSTYFVVCCQVCRGQKV